MSMLEQFKRVFCDDRRKALHPVVVDRRKPTPKSAQETLMMSVKDFERTIMEKVDEISRKL
jgi:hypothetical protein